MKDSVVRARLSSDLKANAARVLASCGLEHSDAIRLFYQQVIAHNGLPFAVKAASPAYAFAELNRLKQNSQERDRRIAASEDVSAGQMFLVGPDELREAKVHWPEAEID